MKKNPQNTTIKKEIKILSLPARHPYMSKFNHKEGIVFVNPDTDYFNNIGGKIDINYLSKNHKVETYDLVHIHFSFDKIEKNKLKKIMQYFKSNKKPIIWTCHGIESQRKKNIGNGDLQKIIFNNSDKIITLTNGCKKWLHKNLGYKKIEVIKHGYIMNPGKIDLYKKNIKNKKKTNFIFLIGDFRQNKEINHSIRSFLECQELKNCKLTVIFKPPKLKNEKISEFLKLIKSTNRIKIISKKFISNKLLNKLFCESHVCILPYLWGTHSGQIELCKDSGCYPVISNVGFYREQSKDAIIFKYNKNINIFSQNFIKSCIKAYKKPFIKIPTTKRQKEFDKIIKDHLRVYNEVI